MGLIKRVKRIFSSGVNKSLTRWERKHPEEMSEQLILEMKQQYEKLKEYYTNICVSIKTIENNIFKHTDQLSIVKKQISNKISEGSNDAAILLMKRRDIILDAKHSLDEQLNVSKNKAQELKKEILQLVDKIKIAESQKELIAIKHQNIKSQEILSSVNKDFNYESIEETFEDIKDTLDKESYRLDVYSDLNEAIKETNSIINSDDKYMMEIESVKEQQKICVNN
jgi:phage shock protein A